MAVEGSPFRGEGKFGLGHGQLGEHVLGLGMVVGVRLDRQRIVVAHPRHRVPRLSRTLTEATCPSKEVVDLQLAVDRTLSLGPRHAHQLV